MCVCVGGGIFHATKLSKLAFPSPLTRKLVLCKDFCYIMILALKSTSFTLTHQGAVPFGPPNSEFCPSAVPKGTNELTASICKGFCLFACFLFPLHGYRTGHTFTIFRSVCKSIKNSVNHWPDISVWLFFFFPEQKMIKALQGEDHVMKAFPFQDGKMGISIWKGWSIHVSGCIFLPWNYHWSNSVYKQWLKPS